MAKPSSLPFSSGRTRATALAAPVVVGMMDIRRPGRGAGPCGAGRGSLVVGVGVDRGHHARLDAELSCRTLTTGARQLVVQEALEMTWWLAGIVAVLVDAQHDGDVLVLGRGGDDHLLGPALQVLAPRPRASGSGRWTRSRNPPRDRPREAWPGPARRSTPSPCGRSPKSLRRSPSPPLPGGRAPSRICSRWASVPASVRSLTATTSSSG